MNIAIQVITMLSVLFITFVSFQALGSRNKYLLFNKTEKDNWDKLINDKFGNWLTMTNIVGILTSLATAYLFFIGNAKVFGIYVFICCITIWVGGFVTNYFTKSILKNEYVASIFKKKEQSAGVIASIFWRSNDPQSIKTSIIVKWISIINILGIIWLEFALFSDIASKLLNIDELLLKILFLFFVSFIVFLFTIKFGLRGFVFADSFQTPLIAISAIALIIGSSIAIYNSQINITVDEFFSPILSLQNCILFSLHVILANLFTNLVTEGHWLRLWVFGTREVKIQIKSLFSTAIIWLLLILVGFFAFYLSGNKIGEDAIIGLLNKLTSLNLIFLVFFWIGGVCALFSTADGQIYSLLLVKEFDTKNGKIKDKLLNNINPFKYAIVIALIFSFLYFLRSHFNLPFEKVIFILMPASLNLLPAFVRIAKGYSPMPIAIILSLIIYLLFSIIGLALPNEQLTWTLSAAFVPVIISFLSLLKK